MKPNKENIITDILLKLESGTTFNACAAEVDLFWGVGENTFIRYWKEANARFKKMHSEIQEQYFQNVKDSVEERQRRGILDKMGRMKILTDIAEGKIKIPKYIVADGIIQEREIVPDYNDRKGAIAELNKMDGDYAPIRKDVTSGGEKIASIPTALQIQIVKPVED